MTTPPIVAALLAASARDAVFGPEDLVRLESVVALEGMYSTAEELRAAPRLAEVEVLLAGWGTPRLDADLLELMPSLRLVLYSAGSVRHLTSEAFWQRGICLVSAADANNDPVAEFVLATTVLALKGQHRSQAHLRTEHALLTSHTGLGIYERRIGLVGFGSIARKVAAGLHRFGHEIGVWDPYLHERETAACGVRLVPTLAEVFTRSQVVSIHAPWLPGSNDHLIGVDELSLMPPGATLINTARGALVDEDALVEVFRSRPDLYAVLDVTWPEPPVAGSALAELTNVQLTGHIAGSVGLEQQRLGRLVVDELERWLAGEELQHQVTEEQARLRA